MADYTIQLKAANGDKLYPAVRDTDVRYMLGNLNSLSGGSVSTIMNIVGPPANLKAAIDSGKEIVGVVKGVWQCVCINAAHSGTEVTLGFLDLGQIGSSPFLVKRFVLTANAAGTAWVSCRLQQAQLSYSNV